MGMEQIKHLSNAFKGAVFSCQNHRFKDFNCQYIYPISYKIEKKANLVKWVYPFLKRYHTFFRPLIFTCS